MKTKTGFLLICLFSLCMAIIAISYLVSLAHADPFLICDPQTNVTHYVVTMDGDTTTIPAFDLGDGTVMLNYDLTGIPTGPHEAIVKAKNVWGENPERTKDFTKALPGASEGLRIE